MNLLRLFSLGLFVMSLAPTARAVPVEGHKIMISGPTPYAVDVGRQVALEGGNVVDVAVAIGLTLSVTTPYYAALGGGGFALVKLNEGVQALDFRETAPAATSKTYYSGLPQEASRLGGKSIAVPGIPAGLWALHKKYGVLKWKDLFKAPLKLARGGFAVSGLWARTTRKKQSRMLGGKKYFFGKNDKPFLPGETLRQPQLAKALVALRDRGPKGFYQGEVAKDIVKAVKAAGGAMTLGDLKNYKVRWLTPMTTSYEGNKIYLMPPPSSGGVVILSALKLTQMLDIKNKPELSIDEFHLLAETQSRAFRGRALLGDPDFHKNPVDFLTSDKYLKEMADSVRPEKTVVLPPLTPEKLTEGTQTTNFSILDSKGHAVVITVTLNGAYGSGVISSRYGIALNDEMDDFTTHPGKPNMFGLIQGEGNDVESGKRPLSSMSPTLVESDGKIVLALGAPGGPRIISSVFQVLYRVLARHDDLDWAIQSPRVHHQFLPNILYVDRDRFTPETLTGLKERGHKLQEGRMANVFAVQLTKDGILEGAFDSRSEGAAGGI
jgi:gamma-glutamyltranspeptidase/glutathione hydrolase